jgi:hypothetical protein
MEPMMEQQAPPMPEQPPGMQAPGANAMPPEAEDPQAEQQYETILAGLLEFVFGKGRAGIEKQINDAENVAEVVGTITYTLIEEASKQAQQAQQDLDMDVMFGVAAELIDSLLRMAEKMGKEVDPEASREEAMMAALQAFLMTAKADPEQQEIARQMLAEMASEGDTDMAASELQRMGAKAGVDPFGGGEPQEKPLSKATRFAMMEGGQ